MHSPNGPIVRERDDTSKRAFLFYKTKSEMNILDNSHTVNRPITAPEVSLGSRDELGHGPSETTRPGRPTPGESVMTCWNIFTRKASKVDRKSLPFQLNIFYGSSENQIINSGKAFFNIVRRRNVRNLNSLFCVFEQLNNLRTPDYSLHKIPEQEKDQIKQGEKQQELKTEEKIETTEPKLKRQVRDTRNCEFVLSTARWPNENFGSDW